MQIWFVIVLPSSILSFHLFLDWDVSHFQAEKELTMLVSSWSLIRSFFYFSSFSVWLPCYRFPPKVLQPIWNSWFSFDKLFWPWSMTISGCLVYGLALKCPRMLSFLLSILLLLPCYKVEISINDTLLPRSLVSCFLCFISFPTSLYVFSYDALHSLMRVRRSPQCVLRKLI